MPHEDALIPFRWESLNGIVLPAFRAFIISEDPAPLRNIIWSAYQQVLAKAPNNEPSTRLRRWYSIHALGPASNPESSTEESIGAFLAYLVSPRGKNDPWAEEYGTRMVQLFRAHRHDLSKRLAPPLWPKTLEGRPSSAADDQVDDLFAELLLFYATPRFEGNGDFSHDPEEGYRSVMRMDLDGVRWHAPVVGSFDNFYGIRDLCPALFAGTRRFPLSCEKDDDNTETWGPLLPSEVPELANSMEKRPELSPVFRRIVQNAKEEGLGLFNWRGGF